MMSTLQIEKNKSLLPFNTFRMDIQANLFAEVLNEDHLIEALSIAEEKKVVPFILGGGSNILFTKNVDGMVIANRIPGIEKIKEDENHVWVRAGSGVVWHALVEYCIEHGYAGIENLSLIPGNVGAAPMQNIGAYGVELKDVFDHLTAVDIRDKTKHHFDAAACAFGYRESVFKRALKDKFVITNVTFKLNKIPHFQIGYGAISLELEKMGVQELSIRSVADAVINIRTSKLPDPVVIGNAGSFFKNPEIDAITFTALKEQFNNIVGYPLANDKVKLAAGWLIEHCGPEDGKSWKGYRVNDAGCHDKQALVLVNHAHARGNEIFELSNRIIDSVYKTFGVSLEREVNIC